MSNSSGPRKLRRELYLAESLAAALKERKADTGINVAEQARRAIEAFIADYRDNPDMPIARLQFPPNAREIVGVPERMWAQLEQIKDERGIDLRDLYNHAIKRYLDAPDLVPVESLEGDAAADAAELARSILQQTMADLDAKLAGIGIARGTVKHAPDKSNPILEMERVEIGALESQSIILKQLEGVPCGPLQEAIDNGTLRRIPCDFAEIMGARDGDWLVPSRGESMIEAGVPDNALVVMRPLDGAQPVEGAIVLACIERPHGVIESTIKFWFHTSTGRVHLANGKLEPFWIPDDFVNITPVAVLVGIMGRATMGTGTLKGRRELK